MDLTAFYKSVLDQDRAPVVLCDLNHTIIYMNQAAIDRYANRGGKTLLGKSLLDCHNPKSCEIILKVLEWFAASKENNIIYEDRNEAENKDVYMVALRDDDGNLIGYYEKHEYRDYETEELYDMQCYEKAMENYRLDSKTYSLDEVERFLKIENP